VVTRVHDDGRVHIENVARQASHLLSAISQSNAIAFVPDGDGLVEGASVPAMILHADQLNGA
jgi:molybdopterin biosynthesis enzyme